MLEKSIFSEIRKPYNKPFHVRYAVQFEIAIENNNAVKF